ncbi:MAG TPA: DUF11 domain-containing protein, partial [Planctomycetes bacterium]|nr:DUF11 domain-containing protein [Planctomycetota bacterium]
MLRIYVVVAILILSSQTSFLFAVETPDPNDGCGVLPLAGGTHSGLIEATYDSTNWVLVLSELILREDICSPSAWYEKVFNPCVLYQGVPTKNNYWGLVSCAEPGQSFPLSEISNPDWYTLDSLYIREGVGFQLFGPDQQPYGPYMAGPKYVSIDHWFYFPAPDGFEPGTFFVHGGPGALKDYSIIIYPKPLGLTVDVLDEPNCVSPYDYINYTICYTPVDCEHTGLQVIDHLPPELDFVNAIPDTGVYDPCNHTYTWYLGDITGGDPNCLELTVQVNRHARPLEQIVNKVEAASNTSLMIVTEETLVCPCGDYGDIIRVDIDADSSEPNGTSWQTAYKYLQDALKAALPCDEIWVADGEYKQSDPNAFQLGHSVRIYGGFIGGPTGEENRYERNWFDNETILNGQFGEDNADYVVGISDANGFNVVDGFTIKGGVIAGIYCDDVSPIVGHNKITDNGTGIYCNRTKELV